MTIDQYVKWDVIMMCVAMAVLFGFEMLGVFTDKYITITALVRMYMPKWIRAVILTLMAYHFMSGE